MKIIITAICLLFIIPFVSNINKSTILSVRLINSFNNAKDMSYTRKYDRTTQEYTYIIKFRESHSIWKTLDNILYDLSIEMGLK